MSPAPLSLQQLEDRAVPAAWGTPWPDAEYLTLSLAPEGTDITGLPSRLYEQFAGYGDWQLEILRAFQTWAIHGNINFAITPDGGAAFGASGAPQGSASHGDIRIGARPLSPGELMIASPFEWFSPWSGDVVVNSEVAYGAGGVDLYSAMLHEAGHTLGLGNDPDPASAMYTVYGGLRAGLSAADVARLQELYGVRGSDEFEGWGGNDTARRATGLTFIDREYELGRVARADLTTSGDIDFYRVQTPRWGDPDFAVSLRTSGVSLLTARVEVFDSRMRSVAFAESIDPRSGDLVLNIDARGGEDYSVRVSGSGDVFGIGAYEIAVGPLAEQASHPDRERILSDGLLNDVPWMATSLLESALAFGDHWEYSTRGGFDRVGDVDHYLLSPPLLSGGDYTMVVTAWGLGDATAQPEVRVFDLLGRELRTQVVSNHGGVYTLQVEGTGLLDPLTDKLGTLGGLTGGLSLLDKYIVRVDADPARGESVGNYFLGVDFHPTGIDLTELASGPIPDGGSVTPLEVSRAQVMHFVLDGRHPANHSPAVFEILDGDGEVVSRIEVAAGGVTTTDQLFGPGNYAVRLTGEGSVELLASTSSDPIGPYTEDPTMPPEESPPPNHRPPAEPSEGQQQPTPPPPPSEDPQPGSTGSGQGTPGNPSDEDDEDDDDVYSSVGEEYPAESNTVGY